MGEGIKETHDAAGNAVIEGVAVLPLRQISDERGKVMHMLRADSPLFTQFGEVYFSQVNPGVVKAWKKHLKMTQRMTVPAGEMQLVIYDDREHSCTRGKTQSLIVGENNYCLVKIPPLVWYGFKCISNVPALIANCTDIPHDPSDVEQISPDSRTIPYNWNAK